MWCLASASSLAAQSQLLDLRFLEVDDEGKRTYHNAVYSYGFGSSRLSFEAFWLFLPQEDGYDEVGVGIGYRLFQKAGVSLSLLGYLASAPDDEYLEPALLASDGDGRLTWSLFLLRYQPLGSDGIGQWLVDPGELQYRVAGPWAIGLSAYLYRPAGGSWLRKLGPKLSLQDRWGATELAVRDVNRGGGLEVQLRRLLTF